VTGLVIAVAVQARVLLTGFQHDAASLVTDALLVLLGAGYGACALRLRRIGRRIGRLAPASFGAGLLTIFVAIGSGLAAYDDSNFSAHIVQHVLLMMVAPPLLCIGRPTTVLAQAAPRRAQRIVVRVANSRLLARCTGWPSIVAYNSVMWLYFFTPWYRYTEEHLLAHDCTHVAFVVVGYLYWHGVLGLEGRHARDGFFVRIAVLVASMPFEAGLGFALLSLGHPLWQGNTLDGTHAGGQLFWTLSMFVSGAGIAGMLGRWAVVDERRRRPLVAATARRQ
jgi:putative membrane protein